MFKKKHNWLIKVNKKYWKSIVCTNLHHHKLHFFNVTKICVIFFLLYWLNWLIDEWKLCECFVLYFLYGSLSSVMILSTCKYEVNLNWCAIWLSEGQFLHDYYINVVWLEFN